MKYIFDEDDERVVLDGLARNQRIAVQFIQICTQRGQRKQAASWAKSARQIGQRITLLEGAFQHKN
jgi:hypothetical protein